MFPLISKTNKPRPREKQDKWKPHLDEAGWLGWFKGSKTVCHDFSTIAAFMSIISFESAGVNNWLANANMEKNSEKKLSYEVTRWHQKAVLKKQQASPGWSDGDGLGLEKKW